MKRLFSILLACLLPILAQAQDTIFVDSDGEEYIVHRPTPVPEFPGGHKALFEAVAMIA